MRYIKEYYSITESNQKEICDNIFKYLQEFKSSNSYSHSIKELLNNTCRHSKEEYRMANNRNPTYEEITHIINMMFNNKKDYGYREFKELYPKIEVCIKSHDSTIDEIEDLFLDIGYKCSLSKETFDQRINGKIIQNSPGFSIVVSDIKKKDISKVSSTIWGTIQSRLPKDFYISHCNISEDDIADGIEYKVDLLICKPIRWDKD